MYRTLGKRIVDVSVVILLLPVWLCLMVMVSLLVFIGSGWPIFFKQVRIGKDDQSFQLIKFKTMRDLPDGNARLTRLGQWLRATSLDEIPQLWLVLIGKMSLVGPRPLLPQYLNLYSAYHRKRHLALPGITGWAQIHGRNHLPWKERFDMDVWYVQNLNLKLDLLILIKTMWLIRPRKQWDTTSTDPIEYFNGY